MLIFGNEFDRIVPYFSSNEEDKREEDDNMVIR